MNAKDCLDILRDIKDVAFATVSADGKPEVRIIDVMIAGREARGLLHRARKISVQADATPARWPSPGSIGFQMVRLSGS